MSLQDKNAVHEFLLNKWIKAIEFRNIQSAVEIDFQHYNQLVKPGEDANFWDKWQSDTLDLRLKITREFVDSRPDRKSDKLVNRFLVVHHNYSGLAHENQLARNLEFLRQQGATIEFDIVYLFGGSAIEGLTAARLYQIPVSSIIFLQASDYPDAGRRLDALTKLKEYGVVLYPTLFQMAFWMSLLVSHCNQKFLQMKYFPLHAGRFSAWGCGRKDALQTFQIKGCAYTQLSILNPRQMQGYTTLAPEDMKIGKSNGINFGSISRPEKVGNPLYNEFIIDLLDRHPSATYLYAGREEQLQHIPSAVRSHPRAQALGWVVPEATIGHYHIYLESFPWGGGDMTLLALENEIPYLILDTPQNQIVGIYKFLDVIAAQSSTDLLRYSFCESIPILTQRFSELVANADLRMSLGKAWSNAIRKYKPSDVDAWIAFLEN